MAEKNLDNSSELFNDTEFDNDIFGQANYSDSINTSISNLTSALVSVSSKYHFYGNSIVIPMGIILVFIIVLAIGGNIMVILTILRHRGMRTRTNMFIVNLAVADILVAALDMPVSLITIAEGKWIFGEALCVINGFTMALFLICSIHTLMYISIHKYISITRPFSRAMTPRRIKLMIAACWLWAAFCALGPVIGWNENVYKKGASQCGPEIPNNFKSRSHSLLITVSNFAVPLTVMSFCYYKIFREIHVHMNRIRKTSNIDLENSVQQQRKVATTLFLVLACFLLCWIPFVLYSNTLAFSKDKSIIPLFMNPLSYWCGYLNSACNPIIYAFRSPSFRKGYKEIMCGAPSPGLSAVNSMSFRSRSVKTSQKCSSNTVKIHDSEQALRRQRTMLSQTSWRSLPLIPNLIRSFSSNKSGRSNSTEEPETPEINGCGGCGLWKSRPTSYEVRKTSDISTNKVHSLNNINEDEETHSNKDRSAYDENIHAEFHNEVEIDEEDKDDKNDEEIKIERDVTM